MADGGEKSRQRKILEFMPKQEVGRTFYSKEGLRFPKSLYMLCKEWLYFSFIIISINPGILSRSIQELRFVLFCFCYFQIQVSL